VTLNYIKTESASFHSWTVDEVQQFQERHSIGPKARLAMSLVLGDRVPSFAILTDEPNEPMAPYHDRMPVVVNDPAKALMPTHRWTMPDPFRLKRSWCVPSIAR
jgi:putative SOS response-associated peptidase YedK